MFCCIYTLGLLDGYPRCLTKKEKIIEGLSTGCDAPLLVRQRGVAARGVFATAAILKNDWLCEYKGLVYPQKEMNGKVEEYDKNKEGCYIVTSEHPVGGESRMCWDATRHFNQIGRYINHALQPNAILTSPYFVRGRWRIGFTALREISVGDEVVWDYGVRSEEEWGFSRLVNGVVVQDVRRKVRDLCNLGHSMTIILFQATAGPPVHEPGPSGYMVSCHFYSYHLISL